MTQESRAEFFVELRAVLDTAPDPLLRALPVAIHVEEHLGITIPADLLDNDHLGSLEAIERTLDDLVGGS